MRYIKKIKPSIRKNNEREEVQNEYEKKDEQDGTIEQMSMIVIEEYI